MIRATVCMSVVMAMSGMGAADVLMTFDFSVSEDDGGYSDDGQIGGSVSLIVYGVNHVGEMLDDQSYNVALTVDYVDYYDMWDIPLQFEGLAVANRGYQDDSNMIWDHSVIFPVGGFEWPHAGESTLGLLDVTEPYDDSDYWSYGLPNWRTTGSDGEEHLFWIHYSTLTETTIPAPAALAIVGLAGALGSRRRRR
ncbi:MAG: hypothetical protein MK116_11325 [Phycisphaerales bacterium]|nr:hypothetical protein [Phycisphaerales bacterium]